MLWLEKSFFSYMHKIFVDAMSPMITPFKFPKDPAKRSQPANGMEIHKDKAYPWEVKCDSLSFRLWSCMLRKVPYNPCLDFFLLSMSKVLTTICSSWKVLMTHISPLKKKYIIGGHEPFFRVFFNPSIRKIFICGIRSIFPLLRMSKDLNPMPSVEPS